MSKVVVDTKFLRGYAAQLISIDDEPRQQLRRYIDTHYRNTDGMVSWLEIAQKTVGNMADVSVRVLSQTTTGLSGTSCALDSAAHMYDRTDTEGARGIFTAAAGALPDGYVETDKPSTTSSFSNGPRVTLPVPKSVNKAEKYREDFREQLGGEVNRWIKTTTGCDLLALCLKLVEPDWGSLDQIGEARIHGEAWYVALGRDLEKGIDTLSSHWTDGGASAAFDHHIREEWLPYIEGAALHERLGGELYVYVSEAIDVVMDALSGVVVMWARFVKKLIAAIKEFSAEDYWDAIKEFGKATVAFIRLLKSFSKSLEDIADLLEAAIDVGVDGTHMWAVVAAGENKVPSLYD